MHSGLLCYFVVFHFGLVDVAGVGGEGAVVALAADGDEVDEEVALGGPCLFHRAYTGYLVMSLRTVSWSQRISL